MVSSPGLSSSLCHPVSVKAKLSRPKPFFFFLLLVFLAAPFRSFSPLWVSQTPGFPSASAKPQPVFLKVSAVGPNLVFPRLGGGRPPPFHRPGAGLPFEMNPCPARSFESCRRFAHNRAYRRRPPLRLLSLLLKLRNTVALLPDLGRFRKFPTKRLLPVGATSVASFLVFAAGESTQIFRKIAAFPWRNIF